MPGVVGVGAADDDVGVTQGRIAQHRLQALDQRPVAAPVDAQRVAGIGGAGRLEVGVDVAAAKAVDRLLGIADQDQRRMPAKRALEHPPLHGVGILKLVHQHDPPAFPHPIASWRVGRLEGCRQTDQQIVESLRTQPALAALEFLEHLGGKAQPHRCLAAGLGIRRAQLGARVGDDGKGQGQRLGVGQLRIGLLTTEVRQIAIVHDLSDQVGKALLELHVGGVVTGHTEGFQHRAAELVGGGDGCRVEVGQRVTQPRPLLGALGVAAAQQVLDELAARRRVAL
ncbi:Uncharacterised protein [Mycobacterium tuberculosis]|nr:Uncharacterised protein [Mycobacterium tuberculosis]